MNAHEMNEMPLERMERMCAAYGADPARWPETERQAAQRLLAHSPAAQNVLTRAGELDKALSRLPADLPDAAMSRLLAATAFPPPRVTAPSLLDRFADVALTFWPRAAVLTGMAALGIVVGLTTEPAYSDSDAAGAYVGGDLSADIIEELAP